MLWEDIKLKPWPEPASEPSGERGEFDFIVSLSRVPEKVWTDEFTRFEQERIAYEPHALGRFDKDRIIVLTTLQGLPERWEHIRQAAQQANGAAMRAYQQGIEDARKAEQDAAAFRAALKGVVNRLPQ